MINRLKIIILILSLSFPALANQELNDFYKELKCLVCQGQSVYESNTDFAKDIKIITEQRFVKGESIADIKKFIVASYGEEILFYPENEGGKKLIWLLPYILLILAIIFYVRSSRRN